MSLLWNVIKAAVDLVAPEFINRRRVRFSIHTATFVDDVRPAFFLNVTNLSQDKEIELTHVWFATSPPVAALPPERPLPKRLKPDETWETWIYLSEVPGAFEGSVVEFARARLSNGREIKAVENTDVPPIGTVPGP